MEWLLTKLVSTFDFVEQIIAFSVAHPEAAAFWGGVALVILNYIVKLTPTKVDDSIFSAVSRAVSEGVAKTIKARKK